MPQKDKGGGTKKYGRNKDKCSRYTSRENNTNTAKTRRILPALLEKMHQPGWKLNETHTKVYRG